MTTEAVKRFLTVKAQPDLAALYGEEMEVQVNVAQDEGELVRGEYNGRTWKGWSDGLTTWKPFRIPRHAKTNPEYTDREMPFDLAAHVEGIGMTGWNWQGLCSCWCAFDFDSITNHVQGLTADEMLEIQQKVTNVDWVTVRRSTSGSGLHIYVTLPDVPTANHDEHAALARAVLGQLSAIVGMNLMTAVDCCGGNMWVWHRKTGDSNGLTLIKMGRVMRVNEVPINWRDHLAVVTNKRRRNLPQVVEDSGVTDDFLRLTNQRPAQILTPEHTGLLDWLRENGALWWWDADNHMLVTHTKWLLEAHKKLLLRGVFSTNSAGTNMDEQNCFCFPARRGAWVVRRFTKGVQEEDSWEQDASGWTKCLFNADPTVEQACKAASGLQDDKEAFHFRYADSALDAIRKIGEEIELPNAFAQRKATIKPLRGKNKLSLEIPAEGQDDNLPGWLRKDKGLALKGAVWQRIIKLPYALDAAEDVDAENYDDLVRHLVTIDHKEYGWVISLNGSWHYESINSVRLVLKAQGYSIKEIDNILGICIQKCWTLVQKPFEPEYTGNREWNLNAAQLKYSPTQDAAQEELHCPTWLAILSHIGLGLDSAVAADKWCKQNDVFTGADYLQLWVAAMFKEPLQPLPYLFLYGDQNCGKSAFHESLGRLITKGAIDAAAAILSPSAFNKELEGAVLCSIEEVNLNKNSAAYNRIKDWVTNSRMLIHEKGQTPYQVPNTTHWVQCANDPDYCPIFPGDTRIVMVHVPPLEITEMIPRRELDLRLEKEASDFLAMVLAIELPRSGDRLAVPVITTQEKVLAAENNEDAVAIFIKDYLTPETGARVAFDKAYARFQAEYPNEGMRLSKKAFGAALNKANFVRGRDASDMRGYVGNVRLSGDTTEYKPIAWFRRGDYLKQEEAKCQTL